MKNKKSWVISIGLPLGFITALLVIASINNVDTFVVDNNNAEAELTWQTIYVWTPTGENDPGHETGGFMSCFMYDYAETPTLDLADNTTDWSTNTSVVAYADADDWSEDTASENASYIVVRAGFTLAQAASGGVYNGSRCRVTLTTTGDETISQTITGNNTAETYGGGIESENSTDEPKIYINFYFDDNSDGYRVTDDGSIVVTSIVIDAKY